MLAIQSNKIILYIITFKLSSSREKGKIQRIECSSQHCRATIPEIKSNIRGRSESDSILAYGITGY